MNTATAAPAAPASAAAAPVVITQAQVDTAVAAARAEGVAEGTALGVTAERERIGAILNSEEAKTRMTLARHFATSTSLTAEAARAALAVSVPEAAAANLLAARMAEMPNPVVGAASGGSADPNAVPVHIDTASIYDLRAKASKAPH
jgi:hypothetical protein